MVEFEKPKDGTAPSEDGAQFSCPYCQDYTGKPDSVRGHIRAKTDRDHEGKSGFEDGTFAEPANEPGTETGSGTDDPELEDDTSDDDDDGLGAALVAGLVVLVLWLASQTGNENQVRNRFGQP
jgi:hypothetical protein